MDIVNLAKSFVNDIDKHKFVKQYNKEIDLETEIYPILKKSLKRLHLNNKYSIISHANKSEWTESKKDQNVIILGCNNTFDIIVKRLSDKKIIAIELKYPKSSPTTAIQTIIGQCIIASLCHPAAIGIVFFKHKGGQKNDRITDLVKKLRKQNIFLLVK